MAPLQLLVVLLPAAILTASRASPDARVGPARRYRPSCLGDYSDGLDVVKRREEEEEEYVTAFYTRVRDKRREMFGRQLQRHDEEQKFHQAAFDHSLDHYFDHQLNSPRGEEAAATAAATPSDAARSVRGGGGGSILQSVVGDRARVDSAAPRGTGWGGGRGRVTSRGRPERRERRGHPNLPRGGDLRRPQKSDRHPGRNGRSSLEEESDSCYDGYGGYDGYDSGLGRDADEGDDCEEHHLGLLRVPCSIAINSEEAALGHHHDHGRSSPETSMAAYVDTGAQVTIISASAAKRAGIYHLMDRRYAGRATGVGHCKVLGRIPARHVHFTLGEERSRGDRFDDGHGMECRGGGEDDWGRSRTEDSRDAVRMDGPALTVLEGTVTKGVDILLGLDVLQDLEAEICMGPRKSITIRGGRGRDGGPVVIPFATAPGAGDAAGRRGRPRPRIARGDGRRYPSFSEYEDDTEDESSFSEYEDDAEDEYYSPTASDIESDLDLLEQSRHGFPREKSFASTRNTREREDEVVSVTSIESGDYGKRVEDYDDYLRDLDEEDDILSDEELEMDLSGL